MTAKMDCLQRALGWCSEFSDLRGRLAVSLPNHVDISQTSKWGGRRGAQNVILVQNTENQKEDRERNLQFISISLSLLRSVLFLDNRSVSLGIKRL